MHSTATTRSIRLGALDVTEVIDRSPLGPLGIVVLVLCGLAMIIDGYDIQVITYVAPVITQQLGVDRSMLGPVFSSGLVGTTLGALIFGALGDRIGRKFTICGCIGLFAVASLGTITASGISSLIAWRLLGGLGLGGVTPIAIAYAAEFCPARFRATATMIIACGFPVGAGGGGFIAAQMIPAFGWQSAFWLGGIAPVLLLVAMILLLPRSIGDLAKRGRSALVAATIGRIAPDVAVDPAAQVSLGARNAGFPIGRLFAEGRTCRTVVLWLMFFTNILALYFMVSWLPTLAHSSGLQLADAVRAAALSHVGSIVGTLSLAALVRRFDTFTVIGVGYLFGAVMLLLLAFAGGSVVTFTSVAFLAGFFVIGTQTGANAVSAFVYPADLRSTGVGWALGVGRTGAILGPIIGGLLIAMKWPTQELFIAAAAPAVAGSLSALVLSRMLRQSPEA